MQLEGGMAAAGPAVDPALDEIARAYSAGDLVVLAGPGVPVAAGLPSRAALLAALVERARGRKVGDAVLAEIEQLAGQDKLAEGFSAVETALGRGEFNAVVEELLDDREYDVPAVALAVAALAPRLRMLLTTGLDNLLERALRGAWPWLLRPALNVGQRSRVIVKLHGTLYDASTWVLTRKQHEEAIYVNAIGQTGLAALFRARTLLFVGFDAGDETLDALLARAGLSSGDAQPRHFALVPAGSVKPFRKSRLESLGVRLVPFEGTDPKLPEVVKLLGDLAASAPGNKVSIAPAAAHDGECPFPGLEVFQEPQERYFFGRDAEIADMLQKLGDTGAGYQRWLQIEGPSGAGKSSLARAGLLPRVRRGGWIAGKLESWRIAVLRPGADPLWSLAQAVFEALKDVLPEGYTLDKVLGELRGSETALGSLLREHVPAGQGVLLLIDQLEELFTLAGDDKAPARKLDALVAGALGDKGGPLHLITTIRSDFVAHLSGLEALGPRVNEAPRYLLKPLGAVGLRAAMVEPARLAGLVWEGGLVKRVLEDASASEGGLPLVAHVLKALWGARQGNVLINEAYEDLGGVGGALTKSADGIVDGLGAGGRERARKMLLRLVKIGRGASDTRQAATRAVVLEAGEGGAEAEEVLARLSGGRDRERPDVGEEAQARLVVVGDEAAGQERVDLVHDALLKQWKTLRGWVEDSRKALERRDDLEAAAQAWEAAGKPEEGLPQGAQLAYLRGAEAPGERGKEYLRKAEEREKRRIRRGRLITAGLAAGVVVLGGLAGYAGWQRSVAQQRLEDALDVADEVVFEVDRKLKPVGGAAEVRKELLEKTGELQEKLLKGAGDSLRALRGRMVSHGQRGDLALTHDNLAQARQEYEAAQGIAQQLVARAPGDITYQDDLALSYNKLGDVAQVGGDLAAARSYYEKSLELTKALSEADPKDAWLRRELSISYEKLGNVAQAGGDLAAARSFYEKGLELRKALSEVDPKNAGLRRDLFVSYNELGEVAQAGGDLAAARSYYEKGLELTKALSEADPKSADLRRDLSISYNKLGDVAQAGGDLAAARSYYEKGLELTKALSEADPKNAWLRRDLSISYESLGDVAQAGGDLSAARSYYEKGLELRKALSEASPKSGQLQVDLAIGHAKLIELAMNAKDINSIRTHRTAAREILDSLDRAGLGKGNAKVGQTRAFLDRLPN